MPFQEQPAPSSEPPVQTEQDAPSAAPAAQSGAAVQPLYVKTLVESNDLRGAIVSPDGETVWALVQAPVVDIGWTIDKHAMTLATALAVVSTCVLLVWLRRAVRRRTTVGALHCRRCDYNVTATPAGAKCPECGVDLAKRPPRRGLTRLRRLGLPVAILSCLVLSYTWYAVFGHKQFPEPLPGRRWGSATLQRWSQTPWLSWLQQTSAFGQNLLEIDAKTGNTRRVIAGLPYSGYLEMAYSPAARAIYIENGEYRVDLVSVDSGRTIARLENCGRMNSGTIAPLMIGHDATGTLAYFDYSDTGQTQSRIIEWNWKTGESRTVCMVESPLRDDGFPVARRHMVVPGNPVRFVRYTDFMENMNTKHFRVWLLDAAGAVLRERDLGVIPGPMAFPSFSADGSLMFLESQNESAVLAFDTTTLDDAGKLDTVLAPWGRSRPVDPSGRFMAIPGYDQLQMRDMRSKTWAPALVIPKGVYAPHSVNFSADGRTVCAVFTNEKGPGSMLGVWRLPQSLSADPNAAPSTTTKPPQ